MRALINRLLEVASLGWWSQKDKHALQSAVSFCYPAVVQPDVVADWVQESFHSAEYEVSHVILNDVCGSVAEKEPTSHTIAKQTLLGKL